MIGSLWNGLSGLNTFERAISVESNNNTNVNTVGYKADEVSFEDLMYQNGYGRGSDIQDIRKKMSQGTIKGTGNTYDVAIEGKGYFIVNQAKTDSTFYTRTGNFRMGTDGLLETANGYKVMGLIPKTNSVVTSDPKITEFDRTYTDFLYAKTVGNSDFIKTINSRTTDYKNTAKDIGVSGNDFRNKNSLLADIELLTTEYKSKLDLYSQNSTALSVESKSQITSVDFSNSLLELNSQSDYIKVKVGLNEVLQKFDTDAQTTLKKLSDKISAIQGFSSSVDIQKGILTINSLVPGKEVSIEDASINEHQALVNNTQNAQLGQGLGLVNSIRDELKKQVELSGGKFLELTNQITYDKNNSLNLDSIQLKLENLKLSKNTFGKIEINEGFVFLNDNNNRYIVGKIQTAGFVNEQGLEALGDNIYKASRQSGNPYSTEDSNKLKTSSLELSNSSVGDGLTKLLVYQKAFEANSKSITTSDEMLKTAMQLIK